jgi:hypothetical protein
VSALTGQVIPFGSTGPYLFSVTVNGDANPERTETFFVKRHQRHRRGRARWAGTRDDHRRRRADYTDPRCSRQWRRIADRRQRRHHPGHRYRRELERN